MDWTGLGSKLVNLDYIYMESFQTNPFHTVLSGDFFATAGCAGAASSWKSRLGGPPPAVVVVVVVVVVFVVVVQAALEPHHRGEAVRERRRQLGSALGAPGAALRRGSDLQDRPLPRQGDGAKPHDIEASSITYSSNIPFINMNTSLA